MDFHSSSPELSTLRVQTSSAPRASTRISSGASTAVLVIPRVAPLGRHQRDLQAVPHARQHRLGHRAGVVQAAAAGAGLHAHRTPRLGAGTQRSQGNLATRRRSLLNSRAFTSPARSNTRVATRSRRLAAMPVSRSPSSSTPPSTARTWSPRATARPPPAPPAPAPAPPPGTSVRAGASRPPGPPRAWPLAASPRPPAAPPIVPPAAGGPAAPPSPAHPPPANRSPGAPGTPAARPSR